jgi:hypothetical protein
MARHTFGAGFVYYGIQAATAAILVLAANTSFAGFPLLASLIAGDRFLPRQFANRGDRLVFSNGIIVLAFLAIILIMIFKGEEQAMLPLYAVGVFLSFTLSQAGMVIHWLRERKADEVKAQIRDEEQAASIHVTEDPNVASHAAVRIKAIERDEGSHWFFPIIINSLGAVITGIVLLIIAITKFTHGAWAVVVLIPLIVLMFRAINSHYRLVAAQLSLDKAKPTDKLLTHHIIIPVSGIHRGVLPALDYARSLSANGQTQATAVYVEINPENTGAMIKEWEVWGKGLPLKILPSPFRSIIEPLLKFIHEEAAQHKDSMITIVLPEFVPRAWWQQLLHNQTALLIKGRLLFSSHIIVTSVPHHLRR